MTNADKKILKRLKKEDKKALTELYDSYWEILFLSSYNILKEREVCEEIIQDVFIDLWHNRAKLQIKISLKAYLYACTRYKVFAQIRKQKAIKVELFDDLKKRFQYTNPETKMMDKELVYQIEKTISTLPKKCRIVYKLSRNRQMSHKEIAEKLSISTKTVENHIGNALRVLKKSLGYTFSILFL
ncbi:RNA polymerase sigma-70 factor [Flavivirga amylovorans]|uniref:RNA polymerase sigma-70 factor n=1 Tax=Flavivirga amylovorans TaxID=870486 RepID=A0ABT8WWT0_9FLAO|nr:RNA polymerase sigma-70 factor [Flavivirga amylovorans]MDO5985810.1 RNA polymerase sigma-70 factor [Flavivirga amylovorans]